MAYKETLSYSMKYYFVEENIYVLNKNLKSFNIVKEKQTLRDHHLIVLYSDPKWLLCHNIKKMLIFYKLKKLLILLLDNHCRGLISFKNDLFVFLMQR